jgi:hypothetical protein
MDDTEFQQQLLTRLDIVIRLLLSKKTSDGRSIAEMAAELDGMGLAPSEIGAILGKSSNYISASLGSRRGKGKGKSQ